jgi:hypothetical protein
MSGIALPFIIACSENNHLVLKNSRQLDVGMKLYLVDQNETDLERIDYLTVQYLVKIPANLLGSEIPNKDLYLSPTQKIIIDDVSINAGELDGVELVRNTGFVYRMFAKISGIALINNLQLIIDGISDG